MSFNLLVDGTVQASSLIPTPVFDHFQGPRGKGEAKRTRRVH